MKIIGIDPGLRHTGWGVLVQQGSRLSPIGCGRISADAALPMAQRLAIISVELTKLLALHQPDMAAMEQIFVSRNAQSTLALGLARGAALAALGMAGLSVAEYPALTVKKSVTGQGRAEKTQVAAMVRVLLPGLGAASADAADALAVAICHAHHGARPVASALSS